MYIRIVKQLVIFVSVTLLASAVSAREYISIVGSSTVYPFTTVVAERYGRSIGSHTPKVESTGTGGGMKLFCGGIGVAYPDATNASRSIKQSEIDLCKANGVEDIIELKVGYDGIVLGNSREGLQFELSTNEIFLALARQVPDENGKLIDNPYTHWNQIDAGLPALPIAVYGPPPTSGTRDAFVELAMEAGAMDVSALADLAHAESEPEILAAMTAAGLPVEIYDHYQVDTGEPPTGQDLFMAVAHSLREDGAFIEAGENDNLIVQKLQSNPDALGIFGFSFLDQNHDQVRGSLIDGVAPSFDAIADGEYSVSRSLYLYIKTAHIGIIPGLEGFVTEYTSENAWGEDGYLADKGLIPMRLEERRAYTESAENRHSI